MSAGAKARILQFQKRLSSTASVSFYARPGSRSQSGWSGEGRGKVEVATPHDGSLTFTETGQFQLAVPAGSAGTAALRTVSFRNVFRWVIGDSHVSLFHERRGSGAAVWLFDLVADRGIDTADLISRQAHRCVNDRYHARLRLRKDGFDLAWTITGPKKDEHVAYQYRSS